MAANLNPKEELEEGEIREDPSKVDKESVQKIINEHKQRALTKLHEGDPVNPASSSVLSSDPVEASSPIDEGVFQPLGDRLYLIKEESGSGDQAKKRVNPRLRRQKFGSETAANKRKKFDNAPVDGEDQKETLPEDRPKQYRQRKADAFRGNLSTEAKRKKRDIPEPQKEICKFFMENRCTFEKCKFSHDLKSVPCKYFHAKGQCTHGEKCRFSHEELKQDEYPKFLKDNEQFLSEISMKQSLKEPLAGHYLAELRQRDREQQEQRHESMQNALLPPPASSGSLPAYNRPPMSMSAPMYPPAYQSRQQVPYYAPPPPPPPPPPYSTYQPMYSPAPPTTYYAPPPLPRASSYYQTMPSVFTAPPALGRPPTQPNSMPAPSSPFITAPVAPPRPIDKPLTFREKAMLSGIIKKDVKPAESEGKETAAATSDPRIRDKRLHTSSQAH